MKEKKEFSHVVIKNIGNIHENNGYSKEINLISWNGAKPVIDIRVWRVDKDGKSRPLKGISFKKEELIALRDLLHSVDLDSLGV